MEIFILKILTPFVWTGSVGAYYSFMIFLNVPPKFGRCERFFAGIFWSIWMLSFFLVMGSALMIAVESWR